MKEVKKNPDDRRAGERIAKVLARAGVASRREVERMIGEGRVALDGTPVETPATLVVGTRGITVDGNPVKAPEPPRMWRYHKPRGLVTTNRDPEGRKTVFDALPGNLPRVISVGRLDINSEGLLILTNDGALARWMELPKTGWKRRYRVRVHGQVDAARLKALSQGVSIEGLAYGPIDAKLEKRQASNAWLEVSLREGKNREVRRVMEHLGLRVTRLIRTAYGPLELGALGQGETDEMNEAALASFFPRALIGEVRTKSGPVETRKAGGQNPSRRHKTGPPPKREKNRRSPAARKARRN